MPVSYTNFTMAPPLQSARTAPHACRGATSFPSRRDAALRVILCGAASRRVRRPSAGAPRRMAKCHARPGSPANHASSNPSRPIVQHGEAQERCLGRKPHCVETMLGGIPQHIPLQPMFIAKKSARDLLVQAPLRDQRYGFFFVLYVFAVGHALVGHSFTKSALEVLHPEAARPRLVISDNHDLKLGLLAR